MDIQDFLTMLHAFIREDFVATSKVKDNEIFVIFNDNSVIKVAVTKG